MVKFYRCSPHTGYGPEQNVSGVKIISTHAATSSANFWEQIKILHHERVQSPQEFFFIHRRDRRLTVLHCNMAAVRSCENDLYMFLSLFDSSSFQYGNGNFFHKVPYRSYVVNSLPVPSALPPPPPPPPPPVPPVPP